jgi:23S rRNA pseudouridine1911/1915/1917 synthase
MKLESRILYEDNHLLIINKPAGVLVQGDSTGDIPISEWAKAYLKKKYNKPGNVFIGVVHRLDRPTSGCLILARTSKALSRMTKIFADRAIKKTYWAIVSPPPYKNKDSLIHYIEKREDVNKVVCSRSPAPKAKEAILDYRKIKIVGSQAVIEIELKTGRKHQIRAQFSSIGSKIVGDLKYGYPYANDDKSICLHCRSVGFTHPVSKKYLEIRAPIPQISEWDIAQSLQ